MIPVDPVTLLAFVPAALALNLTPGADMLFCIAQGLRQGWATATAASAGIAAGGIVHVALAGLGLGAAVAALPWLFDVIRWVGVGYLLWLAVQMLRQPVARAEAPAQRLSPSRAFLQGMVVNLSNPKVILFVLAFIPQFVDPQRGAVLPQFLLLGAIVALGGFVINAVAGIMAGRLGRRVGGGAGGRWLGRVSAAIFAALALRLALLQKG
jgi:threonine/homoserine/homoserine lactone efflux protein